MSDSELEVCEVSFPGMPQMLNAFAALVDNKFAERDKLVQQLEKKLAEREKKIENMKHQMENKMAERDKTVQALVQQMIAMEQKMESLKTKVQMETMETHIHEMTAAAIDKILNKDKCVELTEKNRGNGAFEEGELDTLDDSRVEGQTQDENRGKQMEQGESGQQSTFSGEDDSSILDGDVQDNDGDEDDDDDDECEGSHVQQPSTSKGYNQDTDEDYTDDNVIAETSLQSKTSHNLEKKTRRKRRWFSTKQKYPELYTALTIWTESQKTKHGYYPTQKDTIITKLQMLLHILVNQKKELRKKYEPKEDVIESIYKTYRRYVLKENN